jgi:hypothetical protein
MKNSPAKPFLQAFVNGYHLKLDFLNKKNQIATYEYISDDLTWRVSVIVDTSKDTVTYITVNRLINSQTRFD